MFLEEIVRLGIQFQNEAEMVHFLLIGESWGKNSWVVVVLLS